MHIYALIHLFRQQARLFWLTMGISVVIATGFFFWQPARYVGEVWLSITRTAVTETTDYAYDKYYRLQADERMADTLVAYLMTQHGKQAVAERAGLRASAYTRYLDHSPRIGRRGSAGIVMEYVTDNLTDAQAIGEAVTVVANAYILRLNEDARERTWFTLVAEAPVIRAATFGALRLGLLGLGGGLFLGFWVVLGAHFWQGYRVYQRSTPNV